MKPFEKFCEECSDFSHVFCDDSFDHEFGTESIRYSAPVCGKTKDVPEKRTCPKIITSLMAAMLERDLSDMESAFYWFPIGGPCMKCLDCKHLDVDMISDRADVICENRHGICPVRAKTYEEIREHALKGSQTAQD